MVIDFQLMVEEALSVPANNATCRRKHSEPRPTTTLAQ